MSPINDETGAWQTLARALAQAGRAQPAWRAAAVALGVAPGYCKRILSKLIAVAERSLDGRVSPDL